MVRFAVVPVAYVYLGRDDKVLLQRRQNTGYMDDMWVAGAAGHIELGETAAGTAVREAGEELGVQLDSAALRPVTIMQRTDRTANPREQCADWFFTVATWSGEPAALETNKCAAIAWFSLANLPDEIPEYERVVPDGLAAGTRISSRASVSGEEGLVRSAHDLSMMSGVTIVDQDGSDDGVSRVQCSRRATLGDCGCAMIPG
ncbi:NUDIX domain-containing protein [Rhodococcus artemisiae]|uniref:NUDIX domain-containing protein n=1 Tax=Rhodococcus artemisiae TaxID=714159 RepID=A0ABU7LK38_9NOCA|nr:NUDIX domain-containing protein [Rhodococcus artemisiae]MEE2061612.1 NUDIX domain-containing protein [Rhodococcus artemisiae]